MNQFAKPGLAEEKLPPVSTEDNGKVLGVNNGVWDKVAASGGSDLPEVTSSDKDKYLHTNSSTGDLEWSAVSGGGGGVLVVNLTQQTIDGELYEVCDKTFSEIHTAAQTMPVIAISKSTDGDVCVSVNSLNLVATIEDHPIFGGDTAIFSYSYSMSMEDVTYAVMSSAAMVAATANDYPKALSSSLDVIMLQVVSGN